MTVTDLPPFLSLEDFKSKLDAMEDDGKIQGYRDESTTSPRVVISAKRGSLRGWSEGDAISFLKLRQTKTENFVVVNWDGRGVTHYRERDGVDPVEQYLRDWVEWRFGWYVKRYERMISLAEDELRLLRTIISAHEAKFSERVRHAADRAEAVDMVTEASLKWKPTRDEVSTVVDLPTHRWAKDSISKVRSRITELETKVKEDTKILKSDELRRGVFRADVSGPVSRAVSEAYDQVKKIREEAAEK
jgi:DNA gyrase/topoisomerase IV subunit A